MILHATTCATCHHDAKHHVPHCVQPGCPCHEFDPLDQDHQIAENIARMIRAALPPNYAFTLFVSDLSHGNTSLTSSLKRSAIKTVLRATLKAWNRTGLDHDQENPDSKRTTE